VAHVQPVGGPNVTGPEPGIPHDDMALYGIVDYRSRPLVRVSDSIDLTMYILLTDDIR
jgi:hypothetical protein